jgi:hypothetical protein
MSAGTDRKKRAWDLWAGAILVALLAIGGSEVYRFWSLSQQLRAALAVDLYDDDSTDAVRRLLRQGAPINLRSKDGISVLRFATERGDVGLVRECLDRGQSAGERSPNGGDTPLHYAAGEGQDEVLRLLVQRGADVNARNGEGQTPLFVASVTDGGDEADMLGIVQQLVKMGVGPSIKSRDGEMPAAAAARTMHPTVARWLRARTSKPPER